MRHFIQSLYKSHPLRVIIVTALVIRIIAAFFSEGYAFHDDHFDVTRVADHWAQGYPHWLKDELPPKHSMFYAGVNAAILWVADLLSIEDPIVKTTLLRIFHAFYSLLVIFFGYKITARLSGENDAKTVAWMLALLWFMPYLSVKFLVELVCVPPVLCAFYLILKTKERYSYSWKNYLFAGMLLGLAFTIRMHTIIFAGALGLVMLIDRKWIQGLIFSLGYLVVAGLIIGIPDALFYDYPFQYVTGYFAYNAENANNYIQGSPTKFLFTTLGFLVPPVSIMLIWGYLRKGIKINLQIFLAVAVFFVFHSAFPNQQERFILPMYPLLIILGVIGWNVWKQNWRFYNNHPGIFRGIWKFFWIINIIAALAMALTFTKKDRIMPLYYLYEKGDATSVLIEGQSVKQVPAYYMGRNVFDYNEFKGTRFGLTDLIESKRYVEKDFKFIFILDKNKTPEQVKAEMNDVQKQPNYLILKRSDNLENRLTAMRTFFENKELVLEKVIYPSNFDKLLHFLNPRIHKNTVSYIYKIK